MLQPNKSKGINKYEKKPSIADLIEETNVRRTEISDERNPPKTKQSFRKKTDKEIAQEREAKIQASVEAQKTPYTRENWRQQLASETAATGDKLRVSNEPNFFDDYINPAVMIGDMTSNLGQAPLRAQQSDSVLPYIMSVGAPLTVGALAGIGAKTTGQFVNNITNPLAGTGKLIDNLGNKYLPNAYKYNPRAFKPKTDAYYRQVFSKNEIENPLITRSMQKNNDPKGISAYINSSEEKFLDGNTNKPFELLKLPTTESLPYFNKGKPYYTENYTKFKNNERLLESNKHFKDYEDFNPAATNYMSDKPEQASLALQMSGDIRVLNPFSKEGHNLENYNIYKKDWLQGYKKLQQGGYINQNTNMRRYAQGGDLTQFNEGGLHSQNPLGGVPIGNNNSVEEGETKQNNFVYSNRIFLDSNIVSQYNLPKSLVDKSVADATKFIDNKFKGRNDKISQSTKNGMLSKIAEAQEAMKPQEPEMEQSQEDMIDPTQMALGGYVNRQMSGGGWYDQNNPYFMNNPGAVQNPAQSNTNVVNQMQPVSQLTQANSLSQIKPFSTGNQLPTASAVPDTAGAIGGGLKEMSGKTGLGLSSALGAASTAIDLGKTAFGKPAQDTSGLAPSAKVNSGGMIAGSAMKGASAGMAFGPLGTGIGAAVGGVAGLLGSNKAKKAAIKNANNYAVNVNKQFSDQYALGGEILNPIDPIKVLAAKQGILSSPVNKNPLFNTKRIVKYQPGATNDKLGRGFYLYSKDNTQPGFDPNRDREFIKQSEMLAVQRTPEWKEYMRNQSIQPKQFAMGGKMNQMGVGGFAEDPFDEYSKRTLPQLNLQPINQVIPSFINKGTPINNTQAIIGTKVDGDFGKNSKSALDKYRQSKGMSNVGQPLSAADYTAMGLTSDGYKINKNAFRQQLPENLNLKLDSPIEGFKKYTNIENDIEAGKDKKSIVGKGLSYVNDNLGNLARYAPIATNALQLAQLKKPQGERLDRLGNRYKPEYVDETSLQNIANQTMNNTINAISQSGASEGQIRSSILGSQLQRTKALSDAYSNAAAQNRATNDRAQTFNLGVDQTNLQQSNTEKENFAKDKGNYDTQRSKLIGQLGNDIGNVGKEEIYKKIAKTTTGYSWLGEYQKMNPDATPEEVERAAKKAGVLTDSTTKKALGGYLLKNKGK